MICLLPSIALDRQQVGARPGGLCDIQNRTIPHVCKLCIYFVTAGSYRNNLTVIHSWNLWESQLYSCPIYLMFITA